MQSYMGMLQAKLQGVDPKNIVVVADYDLTMALKSLVNFHESPLSPEQHRGLVQLTPTIGHMFVVTARGEESTSTYLRQHEGTYGPIQNLTLATNSGHVWRPLSAGQDSSSSIIAIPGYADGELTTVVSHIHDVITAVGEEFPQITQDPRELCGAVVYEFLGDAQSKEHTAFQRFVQTCIQAIPEDVRSRIHLEAKNVQNTNPAGEPQTQGYIDFKPNGMDKEYTLPHLLKAAAGGIEEPFILVAGDSKPDYGLMRAAHGIVGGDRSRLLCVSVGEGLVPHDTAQLLDIVLKPNGEHPVHLFHALLAEVAAHGRRWSPKPPAGVPGARRQVAGLRHH